MASPPLLDHSTRFDTHTFDVEAESERTGYGPLRVPAAE
jgi:hypothetical protein